MKKLWLGILIFIIAITLGYIFYHQPTDVSDKTAEKKPLYWIDPMEPTVHYPGPGKSTMGMELVPVYPDQEGASSTIKIKPIVVNNLGIRLAVVLQGALARNINTVGYVEPSENKISHVHTYVNGWIKKLIVKTTGETITKGQLLFKLYSPQLVNAQDEFLLAFSSGDRELINASHKKLLALGISEQQIQQIQSTRKSSDLIDVYADQSGIVASLGVREGMSVTPETEIMTLTDLSTIWILVDVFEKQAAWISLDQKATAKIDALPGKVWQGEVEYIYPQIDPVTRTLKVRLRFTNEETLLKPNMYANVTLAVAPIDNALSIPIEALIRSKDGDHVIVYLGHGQFQPRVVHVGFESGNRIQILSGLKAGEQVVTSGQFLIDSEASLKASYERMK
jgi:Cu(I)/Ag(I) efflux system membrane fusion protein